MLEHLKESGEFKTGFLTMDAEQRILPLLATDNAIVQYPLVGLWVTNLPLINGGENKNVKHPLVWSTCLRFVLCSQNYNSMNSPSSDKNTFLVVNFDSTTGKPEFYEFKIVRNDPEKHYLNNWIVINTK